MLLDEMPCMAPKQHTTGSLTLTNAKAKMTENPY